MFKDLPIKNDSIMTCPCPCHWLPPQDDRVDLGFTRFICVHNPLAWNKRQKKQHWDMMLNLFMNILEICKQQGVAKII